MKSILYKIIGTVTLILLPLCLAIGQPDDPPFEEVPIDGASGILLVMGALFGVKKIYDASRKSP